MRLVCTRTCLGISAIRTSNDQRCYGIPHGSNELPPPPPILTLSDLTHNDNACLLFDAFTKFLVVHKQVSASGCGAKVSERPQYLERAPFHLHAQREKKQNTRSWEVFQIKSQSTPTIMGTLCSFPLSLDPPPLLLCVVEGEKTQPLYS